MQLLPQLVRRGEFVRRPRRPVDDKLVALGHPGGAGGVWFRLCDDSGVARGKVGFAQFPTRWSIEIVTCAADHAEQRPHDWLYFCR